MHIRRAVDGRRKSAISQVTVHVLKGDLYAIGYAGNALISAASSRLHSAEDLISDLDQALSMIA
jgi:hypothetical protein